VRKYDTETGRAIQLEYLGGVLASIAVASKAVKKEVPADSVEEVKPDIESVESDKVSDVEIVEKPKRKK